MSPIEIFKNCTGIKDVDEKGFDDFLKQYDKESWGKLSLMVIKLTDQLEEAAINLRLQGYMVNTKIDLVREARKMIEDSKPVNPFYDGQKVII